MSDTHPANAPEARSPTGELLDQGAKTPPTDTTQNLSPEQITAKAAADAAALTPEVKLDADGKPIPAAKQDESKPTGAPDKYEAFTPPDGYTLDAATITAAEPIFRELGLNQAQAQKLVDFHAGEMVKAAKGPADVMNTMREGWQNEVKADPEIGGILPQVKETIGRALDSLGDPKLVESFRDAMDLTGAGDHLAFIKAFYKMSQAIVEGKHVSGSGPSPHGQSASGKTERPSAATALYPNNPA